MDDTKNQLFYLNGKLQSEGPPSWFTHLGIGVFESMRVRARLQEAKFIVEIVGLNAHLDRLEQGYNFINACCCSREELVAAISNACQGFDWNAFSDARLRIVIFKEDWMLNMVPWKPHFDALEGIESVSFEAERSLPEIKSCSAIASAVARQKIEGTSAGEAFLVDREGVLREGSWSNFFWIDQGGTLVTTASRVLLGVTRSIVLDLARKNGIAALEQDSSLDQVKASAAEAFMTQTSHGIVPVVKLDQVVFGDGKPGPVSKRLIELYRSFVDSAEEPFTWKIEV